MSSVVIDGSNARLRRSLGPRLAILVLSAAGEVIRLEPFIRAHDYIAVAVVGVVIALVAAQTAAQYAAASRRYIEVTNSKVTWYGGLIRTWSVPRSDIQQVILIKRPSRRAPTSPWTLSLVDRREKVVCRVRSLYFDEDDRDELITALGLPVTDTWPPHVSRRVDSPRPVRGRVGVVALWLLATALAGGVVATGAVAQLTHHDSSPISDVPPGLGLGLGQENPTDASSAIPPLTDPNPTPGAPTCSSLARSFLLSQDTDVRPSTAAPPTSIPKAGSAPALVCQAASVQGGSAQIVVWKVSIGTYADQLVASGWTAEGAGTYLDGTAGLTIAGYGQYTVVTLLS